MAPNIPNGGWGTVQIRPTKSDFKYSGAPRTNVNNIALRNARRVDSSLLLLL
jgi:hypothetical protein